MAKPIRAVEFHHPMIQFLIKFVILVLKLYSGIVQIKQFASMSTRPFVVFNSFFGRFAEMFFTFKLGKSLQKSLVTLKKVLESILR